MEKEIIIKHLPENDYSKAVEIFTEGFSEDPLHIHIFPDAAERTHVTRCIYEMMVFDIAPGMNLQTKGIYRKNELGGCIIYTRPDSLSWNDKLGEAVRRMREKANSKKVHLIGEYAQKTSAIKPDEKHIYLNELSVSKKFRNTGLARMLVENAEKDALLFKEVKAVYLDTTNTLNVEIYKKIGYNISVDFSFLGLIVFQMKKHIS